MENFTDNELIEGIKKSDRTIFLFFVRRHWKVLYKQEVTQAHDEEQALDRICLLFANIWDQRRGLPAMDTKPTLWFGQVQSDRPTPTRKAASLALERYVHRRVAFLFLKLSGQK